MRAIEWPVQLQAHVHMLVPAGSQLVQLLVDAAAQQMMHDAGRYGQQLMVVELRPDEHTGLGCMHVDAN